MAEISGDTKRLHPADSGDLLPTTATATAVKPADGWPRSRRRRCCCLCLLITLGLLLALAVVLIVLFLTVLRVRDPTTTVTSVRLAGVVPRLTLPVVSFQLNVTLVLTVKVHNPNPASFAHAGGHTDLSYRGTHVGDAELSPGRIPSRGDGMVELALTIEADKFAADMAQLIADIEAGQMALDTATTIPGRVTFLGLFKRHAVAYSQCHIVLAVPAFKIQSQDCHDRTKL